MAAYGHDGVLVGVDGHRDADLVLRQAPLGHVVRAADDVGVGEVELVDPDAPPQHQAVLVAVHGGEDAVAPLEGRGMGDAAHLRSQVDRRVVAHAGDEALPHGELLVARLEHRPRQRREGLPAPRAPPPLPPGGRLAVPRAVGEAARRAGRARAPELGGLGEGPGSDQGPAPSLGDCGAEGLEPVGVERRDKAPVGVCDHGEFLSAQAATQPGMSPNIGPGGRLGKSMFGIPMVPRVVSGGCGEVTATRTIRYSRKSLFYLFL